MPDALTAQAGGMASQGPSILQFHFRMIICIRIAVKLTNPLQKLFGIFHPLGGFRQNEMIRLTDSTLGAFISHHR